MVVELRDMRDDSCAVSGTRRIKPKAQVSFRIFLRVTRRKGCSCSRELRAAKNKTRNRAADSERERSKPHVRMYSVYVIDQGAAHALIHTKY